MHRVVVCCIPLYAAKVLDVAPESGSAARRQDGDVTLLRSSATNQLESPARRRPVPAGCGVCDNPLSLASPSWLWTIRWVSRIPSKRRRGSFSLRVNRTRAAFLIKNDKLAFLPELSESQLESPNFSLVLEAVSTNESQPKKRDKLKSNE